MAVFSRKEAALYALAIAEVANALAEHPEATGFPSSQRNKPNWRIVGRLFCSPYMISRKRTTSSDHGRNGVCGFLATRVMKQKHEYLLVLPDLKSAREHLEADGVDDKPGQKSVHADVATLEDHLYEGLRFADDHSPDATANAHEQVQEYFRLKQLDKLVVVGHGLGAVLGIRLLQALCANTNLGFAVQGCFFGSPRPGNREFAQRFEAAVSRYAVYQYDRDLIHELPLNSDGAAALQQTIMISSDKAKVIIRDTAEANHHVVSYAAMLCPGVKPSSTEWVDYFRRCGGAGYLEAVRPQWWQIWHSVSGRDQLAATKAVFEEARDTWGALHGDIAAKAGIAVVSGLIGLGSPIFLKAVAPNAFASPSKTTPNTPDHRYDPSPPPSSNSTPVVISDRSNLVRAKNLIADMTQLTDGHCLLDRTDVTDLRETVNGFAGSLDDAARKVRKLDSAYDTEDLAVKTPREAYSELETDLDVTVNLVNTLNHDLGGTLRDETQREINICRSNHNALDEKLRDLDAIIQGTLKEGQ